MRLCGVFLLMICVSISFAALPDGPELEKPVTLAVKGEALYDIVEMLQKQTGVSLSVSDDIAEQKATIFVDDKPLRDVMEALTTLFKYTWRTKTVDEKTKYELVDAGSGKRADSKREAARNKAYEEFGSYIDQICEMGAKTEEELKAMREEMERTIESRFEGREPSDFSAEELEDLSARIFPMMMATMLSHDKLAVPCARFFRELPPAITEDLWSGMEIYYDSESPEPEWRIPQAVVDDLLLAMQKEREEHELRAQEYEDVDPEEMIEEPEEFYEVPEDMDVPSDDSEPVPEGAEPPHDEEFEAYPTDESGFPDELMGDPLAEPDTVNIKFELSEESTMLHAQAQVGFRASGASVPGWDSTRTSTLYLRPLFEGFISPDSVDLPKSADDTELKQKVSMTLPELVDEAALPKDVQRSDCAVINRSDFLALLHKKMGLQVMSDHYSQWNPAQPIKDFELVKMLGEGGDTSSLPNLDEALWGWDGRFLYARTRMTGYIDLMEIPNPLIRKWRQVVAERGYLDLEDLAEMAQMSQEQVQGLWMSARYLGLSQMSYMEQEPLRFYGLLSKAQRKRMFSGGIRVADLNQDQRRALLDLAKSDPWAFPSANAPRIGVYQDGVRIDKPGAPSPLDAAIVSMERLEDQDVEEYEELDFFDPSEAATPAPETPAKSIWRRNAVYRMYIVFPEDVPDDDESLDEEGIWIHVPMHQVEKPKEQAMPDCDCGEHE